jgi:hypothetical protein
MFAPVAELLAHYGVIDGGLQYSFDGDVYLPPLIIAPLAFLVGVFLLFAMLHLARGIGRLQGALAKHLLVQSAG